MHWLSHNLQIFLYFVCLSDWFTILCHICYSKICKSYLFVIRLTNGKSKNMFFFMHMGLFPYINICWEFWLEKTLIFPKLLVLMTISTINLMKINIWSCLLDMLVHWGSNIRKIIWFYKNIAICKEKSILQKYYKIQEDMVMS